MALSAVFYTFSKRQNSTKVPGSGDLGTTFNITLKNPTSMNSPVFMLSADTFGFNYCQFNGAYYFVTDVVSIRNDVWEIHCTKDVLATYRAQILASSAFVLYDTAANTEIADTRLAMNASVSISQNSTDMEELQGNGKYLLCCVGEDSTDTWVLSASPNAITNSIKTEVFNSVLDNEPQVQTDIMTQIADTVTWAKRFLTQLLASGKAPDCIRACYWIPWEISGDTPAEDIYLGDFNTHIEGSKITRNNSVYSYSVQIPWQFTDWRRLPPYTRIYLYLPFIGYIEIPSASLIGYTTIQVEYSVARRTGAISVLLFTSGEILGKYNGDSATTIALGSSNISPLQSATGVLKLAGGAAAVIGSGGAAAGVAGLMGMTSGIQNLMEGQPSCIGGFSGGADAGHTRSIKCITVCHDTNVQPGSVAATIGTPTFAQKTLGSLSGFVQTQEFSLQAAAPDQDIQRVNSYLNGGAFIE